MIAWHRHRCDGPLILYGKLYRMIEGSGIREGEWVHNACLLGRAGADALELNLNFVVTDRLESAPRFTDSSLFSNCAWTRSDS